MGKYNKLVFVGFTFPHHKGTHAGYQNINQYIRYDYCIFLDDYFGLHSKKNFRKINAIWRSFWYRHFGLNTINKAILKLLFLSIVHHDLIFHFIYPENFLPEWICKLIKKKNKFVVTLHQPYDWFVKNSHIVTSIMFCDGIILVSNIENREFTSLFINKKLKYIPHGIDTRYFKIDNNIKKKNILLTVGNWMRDYSFARRVYDKILNTNSEITIVVVSKNDNYKYFESEKRIVFLSNISDEFLKYLYLSCKLLYLPLQRYTANNSLLEAGSMGCNILISSNSHDNCYYPSSMINFCSMDIDETISAIFNTWSNDFNYNLAEYVKKNYSWDVISVITHSFFSNIA